MSQRRPSRHFDAVDPDAVGRVATQVGVVLVVSSMPLLAWAATGLLADVSTLSAALSVLASASNGPLTVGAGHASLFRAGLYGLLSGCWLLGAGLVIDGLFG